MLERLTYLLKVYAWTVLVFVVAKVAFMLTCRDDHVFTGADMWQVVGHGLSLDLSTALYALIVPYLLTIVSVWVRLLRWPFNIYYGVMAAAFALAFVADSSLYPFWQFKLDASCLQYLETPTEAMASVTTGYLLWRLVATVLTATAIFAGYRAIDKPFKAEKVQKTSRALLTTLALLLPAPAIVIGIRGGLDESTTNIGQVYFSPKQFLNHAAVNPVFSFMASFEKTSGDIVVYDFMNDDDCRAVTDGLFDTANDITDTLLTTSRPDIVVILLESMGGIFTADIGGRTDIMPHFNQLCREGVYFSQFYDNSWRTDRGTVCTWSGYPSFPTMSVMKMPAKTRHLPSIAATLSRAGYHTTYLYGGDINFTNMRSYLMSTGFEQLVWKPDFSSDEQRTANWGVRDDITFSRLRQLIDDGPHPQLIGFSTLSSHEPWDVPISHFDDPTLNAFHYLDQCIGSFVDSLRQTPAWQNLLIVMLPDHGINYADVDNVHPLRNHVPMLWIGGAVRQPQVIDVMCNQTDLAATLLAQMGLSHSDFTFSRNVLSRSYTYPFAYHTFRNGFIVRDSTGRVAYDLDINSRANESGTQADRLERMGKALLQLTTRHLKNL